MCDEASEHYQYGGEHDTTIDEAFDEITKNEGRTEDSDSGDHDLFSHYVPKEEIIRAATTGVPATALCGKKWTPSRNPEKYPVCPECKDVYEAMVE